ncbi:IPT/TIG domain-containing protein [Micromonospora aurantiaca (nom. illeg.)]|uniref:IPT/TIG domain-containing protein n=1 Tax=Micromonospora aurantiaca (nom. illeg.) TaxID=47850 RepID=UPI0033D397A7
MAAPVIRSITASKTTLTPGESTTVTVDAFDPDARTITLSGRVVDAGGNVSSVTTELTVGDPITYELTSSDESVTVVADPANPGRFTVTV